MECQAYYFLLRHLQHTQIEQCAQRGKQTLDDPVGHNIDWPCMVQTGIATATLFRDFVADEEGGLARFLATRLHCEDSSIRRFVQTVLRALGRVRHIVTLSRT